MNLFLMILVVILILRPDMHIHHIQKYLTDRKSKKIFDKIKVGEVWASYYYPEIIDELTIENYSRIIHITEKSQKNLKYEIIDESKPSGLILMTGTPFSSSVNIYSYLSCGDLKLYTGANPKVKKILFDQTLKTNMEEKA